MKQVQHYESQGHDYSSVRHQDPRIAEEISKALGHKAKKVLNVGAGAGSYEPQDRYVVALEPSSVMRSQRPSHRVPAIAGNAEAIPFDDQAFDAGMAVLTVHHWPDLRAGMKEFARVVQNRLVVMTFDPFAHTDFWLSDYLPEMAEVERWRYPTPDKIFGGLKGKLTTIELPMYSDCQDKFQVALFARPEAFLRPEVRRSQSAWSHLPDGAEQRFHEHLSEDLSSGVWDEKYGALRRKPTIKCQLRVYCFELDR